jgi:protein arginine N-methyltransferase 3
VIPSHCTLRIAPVIDPDYIESAINFWKSVYGFSMTSMLDSVGDDVAIRQFQPSHIAAASTSFLHLPLHTITREDLSFANHSFSFTLTQDIDALDGFAIWFDTFFCRSATRNIEPEDAEAEAWKGQAGEVAFTTGPGGTGTHWQQGMLLIDHTKGKKKISSLKQGQIITGSIGYSKRQANSRELDIEVKWDAGDADDKGRTEHGRQIWFMR